MPAEVIFGDIRNLDPDDLRSILLFQGIKRIDTAARYMDGESERNIGRANLSESFEIDTKIATNESGDYTLTTDSIEESLTSSLAALRVDQVHILYCHTPDRKTPIIEQARAFDCHYKRGRFLYLGVSNFSTAMVQQWLDIAEKEGLVKPSVFQGQYNLLCRSYEDTLFPVLRRYNMRFGAFSPLAGGFLLGNLTADGVQAGSRFTSEQSQYKQWYDHPSMHGAITKLRTISEKTGLGMDELSLRWLKYHSALNENDWLILGASKISQVKSSCEKAQSGPLDATVVRQLDDLWLEVKATGVDFKPS